MKALSLSMLVIIGSILFFQICASKAALKDTKSDLAQSPSTSPEQPSDSTAAGFATSTGNSTGTNTGSYGPRHAACPTTTGEGGLVRQVTIPKIGTDEADYIQRHMTATQKGWAEWLSSTTGPNLDGVAGIPGGVAAYTSKIDHLPKVGIALSGGGYRAMIHGAGFLRGLDSREAMAKQRGTGGFLQLASYLAGTSGGSWTVGSLALNDWPTIQQITQSTWSLDQNLLFPAKEIMNYYPTMIQEVAEKTRAGFPTGITDYWGRAISHHLVGANFPSHGEGTQFSEIKKTSNFISAAYPFPLVNAEEAEKGNPLTGHNTVMFEFTPFEFGSWDPTVAAFIPIEILGTSMSAGKSTDGQCVYGFENFGWVLGTSSAHFKALFSSLGSQLSSLPAALQKLVTYIASQPADGSIVPNPFFGSSSAIGTKKTINLVDGGEDLQTIPLDHLLQPSRGLDMILAVDSSNDVTGWPNGAALHETYLRISGNAAYKNVIMPAIPDEATFISQGLNTRPVFFDCGTGSAGGANKGGKITTSTADLPGKGLAGAGTLESGAGAKFSSKDALSTASAGKTDDTLSKRANTKTTAPTTKEPSTKSDDPTTPSDTAKGSSKGPLIVYMANYPWSTLSNTSTFQFAYEPSQYQAMMDNAMNVATMGGLTQGAKHWPTCLACASLQRSFERTGTDRPKACDACMEAYCWNEAADASQTGASDFSPSIGTPKWVSSETSASSQASTGSQTSM